MEDAQPAVTKTQNRDLARSTPSPLWGGLGRGLQPEAYSLISRFKSSISWLSLVSPVIKSSILRTACSTVV